MKSSEGEIVEFRDVIFTFKVRGQVEKWLLELEVDMIFFFYKVIGELLDVYLKEDRKEWVKRWLGQVVLCVIVKYWIDFIEDVFKKGGIVLKEYLDLNIKQIDDIVVMVRGILSKQNRVILQVLIVLDVYVKDVLFKLVENDCSSDLDFQWLSQFRYYWEVRKFEMVDSRGGKFEWIYFFLIVLENWYLQYE